MGIESGDEMLVSVASALSEEAETPGTSDGKTNVVGRFGGEEFGVVLAERPRGGYPSREDAVAIAERMRSSAEALRVKEAGVTLSMGVASLSRGRADRRRASRRGGRTFAPRHRGRRQSRDLILTA